MHHLGKLPSQQLFAFHLLPQTYPILFDFLLLDLASKCHEFDELAFTKGLSMGKWFWREAFIKFLLLGKFLRFSSCFLLWPSCSLCCFALLPFIANLLSLFFWVVSFHSMKKLSFKGYFSASTMQKTAWWEEKKMTVTKKQNDGNWQILYSMLYHIVYRFWITSNKIQENEKLENKIIKKIASLSELGFVSCQKTFSKAFILLKRKSFLDPDERLHRCQNFEKKPLKMNINPKLNF